MAVSVYPVLCVLLTSSLLQAVLSQNNGHFRGNFQRQDMPNAQRGRFNPGNPQQRGLQQSGMLSGRGQLSAGQGSGMMNPYSGSVAISSADAVLSHQSLGPSGRPLHAMRGGPQPRDRSQGSMSHVQDMAIGGNAMQSSPPNPWNQPEVHGPGFIHSQGPLVVTPLGGPRIDRFQAPSRGPLNKMEALMIDVSKAPMAIQPQMTEPLVPGYVAQPRAPLHQEPVTNQWPSKAPLVTGSAAQGPNAWKQGVNQPLTTMPKSILIDSEPKSNLALSKPGFQPELPIGHVKQKQFPNKNKDLPFADVNTGSNTFASHQQPLAQQFAPQTDVKMLKNAKNAMAEYAIIKDSGPMGPLLPGSPAPPTQRGQIYKSTPINAQLNTVRPQYPLNMATGITDVVYRQTINPILSGAPGVYTDAWTTGGTTMPAVTTTDVPSTTTTAVPTTTNIYTEIQRNTQLEKLKREKGKELAALRLALQQIGIPNTNGLYTNLGTLSTAARKSILMRAEKIQKKKRSRTRSRTG